MGLPVSKNTNYGIGVACVVFLVIAAWYGSSVLSDLGSWNDWDKPAEVAKMWKGIAYGGVGFLLAMGVNLFEILRPVLSLVPGLSQFAKTDPPAGGNTP